MIYLCAQEKRERGLMDTRAVSAPVGELCSILALSCFIPISLLQLTFLQTCPLHGFFEIEDPCSFLSLKKKIHIHVFNFK